MKLESIVVAEVIPASPERIYRAWLDAKAHSAFTGGSATSDSVVGGKFSAWDDYIQGVHEELVPNARIVQRWRSTDFPVDAGDSKVTITLAPDAGGTLVTLEHTEIPEGQGKSYEDGWVQYYFAPMRTYFTRAASKAAPAKKKAVAAKKAAPAKKAVAAKKAAPTKKKKAPTKKAAPAKKKAPTKKAAPAKKRASS